MWRVMSCLGTLVAVLFISSNGISQEPAAGLVVPAGTKLELAVTRAVWAARVKAGDTLYAQTVYPVAIGNNMAIPAGTYVEGAIESFTQPTRRDGHAEFHLRFDKVIYADGYVAELAGTGAAVKLQVSRSSDILIDNGTQIEMTLGSALTLDSGRVTAAVAVARAPKAGEFARATLCRPTAGTPGSDGITIPGTPPSPPTIIPGAPGMPDTVIPGTPGTPSQVVGQMPGTPGTVCPAPPIVIFSVPEAVGSALTK